MNSVTITPNGGFKIAFAYDPDLVDEVKETGYYTVTWNGQDNEGNNVGSGIYICRMEVGTFAANKRLILIK